MLSYHDDEKLKELVVSEMKRHQEQGQFMKHTYEEDDNGKFKGCAVGCTIDSVNKILGKSYDTSEHCVLEEAIGVPEWLSKMQDLFFEKLPDSESTQFAVDFLNAIPVGVNLEPVKWKFCAFLMKEGIQRVQGLPHLSDKLREQVLDAIKGVLQVHENAINTGKWDQEAAKEAKKKTEGAKKAAWAADWSEYWSSEWSAVRAAAFAAEESAMVAAADAADAAARAAPEGRAEEERQDAYKRYANELLRLLRNEDKVHGNIQV